MSTKKAAAPQAAKRPAKAPKSTRRTEGQRLYDEVAELERKLKGLMDEIPRFMLRGRRQGWETCNDLREAIDSMANVVDLLLGVRNREVPRYNRSAEAQS